MLWYKISDQFTSFSDGPSLERENTYSKMDGNIQQRGLLLGGVITQGLKQVSTKEIIDSIPFIGLARVMTYDRPLTDTSCMTDL